jgi:hypothetical protein
MSGRYRRRYGFSSRRRFSRAGYRGSRYGSSARRSRGNVRAASQQNDISNVVINVMKKIKTGVAGFAHDGVSYDIGTCVLNIFEILAKSEFYQSYSNMYDQFRINRIQVKATPVTWKTYDQFNLPNVTQANGLVGNNNAAPAYPDANTSAPSDNWTEPANRYLVPQALTIVTAWDRTGLDTTQLINAPNGIANSANIAYSNIGDKIASYSSAKTSQLVAGANFSCVRYLYPTSQQEKALYFSTSDLVLQTADKGDADHENIKKWYAIKKGGSWNSHNITNLLADPTCPFKPTFMIGVLKVDELGYANVTNNLNAIDTTTNQIYPVTFNLEFDIGVTFRGLRKTQIV